MKSVSTSLGSFSLHLTPIPLDYLLAHSQQAVVPCDPGGPHGKHIKVTLGVWRKLASC